MFFCECVLFFPEQHPFDKPIRLDGKLGIGDAQRIADIDIVKIIGEGTAAVLVELEEVKLYFFYDRQRARAALSLH